MHVTLLTNPLPLHVTFGDTVLSHLKSDTYYLNVPESERERKRGNIPPTHHLHHLKWLRCQIG